MIYENLQKVNGPYSQKNGRLQATLVFLDGTRKTISYPKYLMELHLNRYLLDNETVDHIDVNFLNNDISNLQVLDRIVHVKKDVTRNQDVEVNCTYCDKLFIIQGSKLHTRNRKDKHQSGYFCSRSCSGKYGVEIQRNKRLHIQSDKIIPVKYQAKNLRTIKETLYVNGVNSKNA